MKLNLKSIKVLLLISIGGYNLAQADNTVNQNATIRTPSKSSTPSIVSKQNDIPLYIHVSGDTGKPYEINYNGANKIEVVNLGYQAFNDCTKDYSCHPSRLMLVNINERVSLELSFNENDMQLENMPIYKVNEFFPLIKSVNGKKLDSSADGVLKTDLPQKEYSKEIGFDEKAQFQYNDNHTQWGVIFKETLIPLCNKFMSPKLTEKYDYIYYQNYNSGEKESIKNQKCIYVNPSWLVRGGIEIQNKYMNTYTLDMIINKDECHLLNHASNSDSKDFSCRFDYNYNLNRKEISVSKK
jgi:hypothetical protein